MGGLSVFCEACVAEQAAEPSSACGMHLCHLAGAEAPLPRHQLIAVFFFAHGYRLQ